MARLNPHALRATLRSALAHRLTHFALLGGAIFALAPRAPRPDQVELSEQSLSALHGAAAQRLGTSALDDAKRREVDARAVEDEILYREALRMGLDRGDPIVRERLIQKLLLLVEDLGGASRDPSEGELRSYFEAHRQRYQQAEKLHFVHVFSDSAATLPEPSELSSVERALGSGKAFPYPREQTLTQLELARLFGQPFADAVAKLAPGAPSAALRSTFGWHRVALLERIAGRPATFAEARSNVTLDFLLDRRERVVGSYLLRTAKRYDVVIDGKPLVSFEPTRRVAARQEGSAED